MSQGERSGLVKDDGADPGQRFHHVCVAQKHIPPPKQALGGAQSKRSAQRQRTRACDDEHGGKGSDGAGDVVSPPPGTRGKCDRDDRQREDAAEPVEQRVQAVIRTP